MKKIIYFLLSFSSTFFVQIFADDTSTNITWIANSKLKEWDVTFSDIPKAIQSATSFLLYFAPTVAMIMIIVGWLRFAIGSVEWDTPNKSKAKDTIKYWIIGMVISVSAWFIINIVIKNL